MLGSLSLSAGYPHNPYNGVICNDVIAASGVFTAKELWKFTKGKECLDQWELFLELQSVVVGHGQCFYFILLGCLFSQLF